ncbi:receptor-like protein 9DC3 [Tripterygium wilfordii]|uniref:receptor-like protein 9DC3 n=1 Tax=Tripterygium wilfordii TaxID=458696 RepID=UPI0018F807F1|nr:receptor-like protein 9DC3 [Tripterygium wilfordii]
MEQLIWWLCQIISLLLVLLLNLQFHFSSSFAFSANSSSTHLCLRDQRLVLQELKNTFSINSDASENCEYGSYPKTQSWKEENDCCSWDGVTCDVFSGHVIGLDLSCSRLRGSLSSNNSLFRLRRLQSLNLAGNNFLGSSISSKFGEFQSMMHLNLSYSSFSGRVPSEISYLSNMISLDISSDLLMVLETLTLKRLVQNFTLVQKLAFSGVDMSSSATVSLMNLSSSLRYLNLDDCGLRGNFPENLFRLQNLEFLFLTAGEEGLMVDLPSSNWSSPLQYLLLDDISFPFQLPESIGNLKFLKYFALSTINCTGTLPASIRNLTQLEVLSLSDNQLSGPIPDISNLSKLTFLDLSGNNLSFTTNTNPNSTMPNLRSLSLPSCNITDFPNFLRDSKDLASLDLSNNRIRGPLPDWMYDVGVYSLSYLNLAHNFITNVDRLPWKSLEALDLRFNSLQGLLPVPSFTVEVFMVSANKLTGPLPYLICNASLMKVFDISKNNLSGAVPECIGSFSRRLSVLDLQMNNFHGKIPGTFSKHNVLRTLNLHGNNFEGPLPRSVAHCEMLEVLDVGNNKLNDMFPDWLQTLSELQVLVLRSNKFHGSIPDCNGSHCFPKLRIFDISNNNFVGPLPAKYIDNLKSMMDKEGTRSLQYMEKGFDLYHDSVSVTMKGLDYNLVKILTTFTTIDFSNNKLEGDIPEVIGKLISLKGLNFSHNNLIGFIPSSVGNLSSLEWLDLSWNKLIGEIPGELAELKQLSHLNLSENKLVGSIPSGSQLVTFDNSSYEGNLGLCGFPLSKKCGDEDHDHIPEGEGEDDSGNELDLKIVMMGYWSGLVCGLSLGYITFSSVKPRWFARIVEGNQAKKVKRKYQRCQGRRK